MNAIATKVAERKLKSELKQLTPKAPGGPRQRGKYLAIKYVMHYLVVTSLTR